MLNSPFSAGSYEKLSGEEKLLFIKETHLLMDILKYDDLDIHDKEKEELKQILEDRARKLAHDLR